MGEISGVIRLWSKGDIFFLGGLRFSGFSFFLSWFFFGFEFVVKMLNGSLLGRVLYRDLKLKFYN